jgi:hypothetical protein
MENSYQQSGLIQNDKEIILNYINHKFKKENLELCDIYNYRISKNILFRIIIEDNNYTMLNFNTKLYEGVINTYQEFFDIMFSVITELMYEC